MSCQVSFLKKKGEIIGRKGLRDNFFKPLNYPIMNTKKGQPDSDSIDAAIDNQITNLINKVGFKEMVSKMPTAFKKRVLVEQYYNENLTDGQIAIKLRCTSGSVKAIRWRLGLGKDKD